LHKFKPKYANTYILEKIAAASEAFEPPLASEIPRNFQSSGILPEIPESPLASLPSKPRVGTPAYYYDFVELVS